METKCGKTDSCVLVLVDDDTVDNMPVVVKLMSYCQKGSGWGGRGGGREGVGREQEETSVAP